MYMALKHTHMLLAAISIVGFLFRAIGHLSGSTWVRGKLVRIVPHVVDTLFLATGIALLFQIQQYPLVNDWLTVKVIGLIAYIVFGVLAFRVARTIPMKAVWTLAALGTFAFVASVALTRQAAGLFA